MPHFAQDDRVLKVQNDGEINTCSRWQTIKTRAGRSIADGLLSRAELRRDYQAVGGFLGVFLVLEDEIESFFGGGGGLGEQVGQ